MTLKAARINKGLSLEDASVELGISPDCLRSYEAGKTFPTVPKIRRMEAVYGVPYSEIDFLV